VRWLLRMTSTTLQSVFSMFASRSLPPPRFENLDARSDQAIFTKWQEADSSSSYLNLSERIFGSSGKTRRRSKRISRTWKTAPPEGDLYACRPFCGPAVVLGGRGV
jgi:hypothetical protein